LHGFYGPAIAVNLQDDLNFGVACRKPRYRTVHVYNVGNRDLMILSVQRVPGSSDFTVLPAPATPLAIAPGAGIDFTVEYRPTVPGVASTATIQLTSNDPVDPTLDLVARGESGAGKLAVSGSTYFGGVPACCHRERTIWLANVGDCGLNVSDVAFKHPAKAWKLVSNAFPAVLHPGGSLAVVIRYHAAERYARVHELVITSDDPHAPIRELDLLAHTVWDEPCRDERARGCCGERGRCEPSCRRCERCPDGDEDQDQAEAYSPA
jgi:Abnormal spindle-like microcephaly-assoc'd, ASPM-SPD-2-Hydin